MVKFKTRQRGSVKVFVIVGLVLTVLAFGTLYGAKRVAMNDQTPPMNVPETTTTATETSTETGNQAAQNNNTEANTDKSGATEEQTNTQSTTENTTSRSSNTEATTQSAADDLPQTGPTDNAALATVLTATAVVAFVKSRRLL